MTIPHLLIGAKAPNAICHTEDSREGDGGISFPVRRTSPPAT